MLQIIGKGIGLLLKWVLIGILIGLAGYVANRTYQFLDKVRFKKPSRPKSPTSSSSPEPEKDNTIQSPEHGTIKFVKSTSTVPGCSVQVEFQVLKDSSKSWTEHFPTMRDATRRVREIQELYS